MARPGEGAVEAVVVAHDSAAVLPACLRSLGDTPTLVVDNASRDGSAALAASLGARVLALPRNEGFGRAANRGAAAASAALTLVLNPDVTLDEGAVDRLVGAAERYPDAGLFAPRLLEPDGRLFFQPRSLLAPYLRNERGGPATPDGDCCAPFLSGACLLLRRDLFLALGGFDEAIFLFYEDDDLCRRVAEAGRSLVHVHDAVARHGRGRSSAPRPGRVFASRWHQAWSRAYVSAKWGLPDPSARMAALNAAKAALAAPTFSRARWERYAGSAAGALAWRRGETALGREGLL